MTISDFTIRNIRPDEYDEVAKLSVEAYRQFARGIDPQDWMIMEANLRGVEKRAQDGTAIVAELHGKLVGSIAYFAPGTPRHERFPSEWALVIMLAVDPAHRRKGVGRLLTEECVRRARLDGATQVGLHTSELMTAARLLYERMGFRQQQEFQLYGLRYWIYTLRLE